VPGSLRKRPLLTPSCHPAVHQGRIPFQRNLRTEAEPLGDPGTETLDEHVRTLDQSENNVDAGRVLEVHLADTTPTLGLIPWLTGTGDPTGALNTDDVSAEISEQRRCVGTWTDSGKLYDAKSGERSAACGGSHDCPSVLSRVEISV
jgi:hypothetical protein